MTQLNSDLTVVCRKCGAQVKLASIASRRSPDNDDLWEYGLLCPSCETWTHSYWMTKELAQRRDRLEQLQIIFKQKPTEGRWTTYVSAREAYNKEFMIVQKKHEGRANEATKAS